ncbi:MAG: polyketide cyclase [Gammaproteobacteria bacterium]|nr:polyketide cyclase [Gammaproteobacteria bacterium]
MKIQVEHRITVAAQAATIYRIYEDVQNWQSWDPDTKHAYLDGPFKEGSHGRLTPTKGRAVPMVLTEAVPNRNFTVESKIPLFRMVFEHELIPNLATTEVIHRVTFSGLLSVLLGTMLAKQLNKGLPVHSASSKRLLRGKVRSSTSVYAKIKG